MNKQSYTAEGATGCGPAQGNARWAHRYGYRNHFGGNYRAPVSIYKTDTTYELMVFAPGREKENFSVTMKGEELVISYKPTTDTSNLDWVRKEYSRGGFERSFMTDQTMDTANIDARYENGVLHIRLQIKPESAVDKKEVKIN